LTTLAATLLSNSRTNLPRRLQNHGLFSECLAAKRDETNSIQNGIGRQNPQVVPCLFSNVDLFHQEFVRVGVLFATGAGIALWVASGRVVYIFHVLFSHAGPKNISPDKFHGFKNQQCTT